MSSKVLVLNAGSSSLKFKLFDEASSKLREVVGGLVERIGDSDNSQLITTAAGSKDKQVHKEPVEDHTAAMTTVLHFLRHADVGNIDKEVTAVGHRVVHGKHIPKAVLVDENVIQAIREAAPLAPLHNPANLQGILAAQRAFSGKPSVAVFDTAFHQTMPPKAFLYALPYDLYKERDLQKYGAHGTSVRYLVKEAAQMLGKPADSVNLIVAHIGAGASITAIENGKTLDTSMGLTPLEGLVMGTRCGDMDPSVVVYLQRHCGLSVDQADDLMNKQSGLLGLGGKADLRAVTEEAKAGSKRAAAALEVFVHRIRKYLGAYLVHLKGRVDAIVFSAGIGENAAHIRQAALADLEAFGIAVDDAKNKQMVGGRRGPIQMDLSPVDLADVKVFVIPTDEEVSIAEQTLEVVRTLH